MAVRLEITDMSHDGQGVGRLAGKVVFVSGALPGEVVDCELIQTGKSFSRARLTAVLQASPSRVEPDCAAADGCGGCAFAHTDYQSELEYKRARVQSAFSRIGRLDVEVSPTVPCARIEGCRNKVTLPFGQDGPGRVFAGVFARDSHTVLHPDGCTALRAEFLPVIAAAERWINRAGLRPFDEAAGRGEMQRLSLRLAEATGEISVLLAADAPLPDIDSFAHAIGGACPAAICVAAGTWDNGGFSGVKYLTDKEFITDILCGFELHVAPDAFYQVNSLQSQVLYTAALEAAGRGESALDLCCGIGGITLCLSRSFDAVEGAEISRRAVGCARENARINKADNASFICADACAAAAAYARDGRTFDVVVTDPPRAGMSRRALEAMAGIARDRIVYVSCDPATLARDCAVLAGAGFVPVRATPVDMFPRAGHVETVVLLSHKKPDSIINVKVEFGEGEDKVPLGEIAKKAEAYKPKERVTYKMIKEYIEEKYGFKVHTSYIAEVKRSLGLPMYDAPNAVEELKHERKHPTQEKVDAIKDSLKYFKVI